MCEHTTFSPDFLFGWFSTANLPPNSGAEEFLRLFRFQEGLEACYEAPDVFLIADHSLGDVGNITYPMLNTGSLASSFCHELSIAEVSRDYLAFECWGRPKWWFISFFLENVRWGARSRRQQGCQCHPGSGKRCGAVWCTKKCCKMQVSDSNISYCVVLKLSFGTSQYLEKKNQGWNSDDET